MNTKRMLKRSSTRHTPSVVAEQVSKCHEVACYDIEAEYNKQKAWSNLQNTHHESRWKAGTCLICGEYMQYCITNYHANLHGYKTAEDLIKAGMIAFD